VSAYCPREAASSARGPRTSLRHATNSPARSGASGPTGPPAPAHAAAARSPASGSAPSPAAWAPRKRQRTATRRCAPSGRTGPSGRSAAPPVGAACRPAPASACCPRVWRAATDPAPSRGPATIRSARFGPPGRLGHSARSPAAVGRDLRCGSVSENCNESACPRLTEWSDWSECSRSCGGGKRTKRRQCVYPDGSSGNGTDSENDCLEQLEVTENCNTGKCPEYGSWSDWTPCTKSCGGGTRKKVRDGLLRVIYLLIAGYDL
jgi:hypothetical protein